MIQWIHVIMQLDMITIRGTMHHRHHHHHHRCRDHHHHHPYHDDHDHHHRRLLVLALSSHRQRKKDENNLDMIHRHRFQITFRINLNNRTKPALFTKSRR